MSNVTRTPILRSLRVAAAILVGRAQLTHTQSHARDPAVASANNLAITLKLTPSLRRLGVGSAPLLGSKLALVRASISCVRRRCVPLPTSGRRCQIVYARVHYFTQACTSPAGRPASRARIITSPCSRIQLLGEVTRGWENEARQISPVIQEYIDQARHEIFHGPSKRCPAQFVHDIELRQTRKHRQQLLLTRGFLANRMQRCRSVLVNRIRTGASSQQQFNQPWIGESDDESIRVVYSKVQWCITVLVHGVDLNLQLSFRHGGPQPTGLGGRRERGPDPTGAPPRAQGLGGEFRPAQDDAPVAAPLADGPVALSALRLPQHAAVLLRAHGALQEDQEDGAAAVAARPAALARVLLLRRHQQSQLRQDARQSHMRADTLGQEHRGPGQGQTGFPWIDAIMTQLREEGWIHHLARHAVACFLTRGDLWISWEEGMKVFDELLLDADWSINAGMWMWLSCSSFFQQFFHCYCPVRFGRKADPNGDYIRRYLPVLKNFPTRYIHEPWNAPLSVQRAAKCTVGRDYSLPMVNHSKSSRINVERMKQVYQQLSKYRANGLLSVAPTPPLIGYDQQDGELDYTSQQQRLNNASSNAEQLDRENSQNQQDPQQQQQQIHHHHQQMHQHHNHHP
ncbi:unnamed protein product [Trichogramma brassicae]|uniref:Cryptochrome/DNA photolyase FAD-binding domain-containing protein n=1 Tax=Trichogramma brassicae TaxID=86971 RepID=A0A6H5IXQ4_9HYME|nr:unnamed protein product [Trichogramma brassicae]